MKKLLFFMLTAVVLTAVAQQPAWYDAARRSADYPAGQYFTGYAEGQRLGSERQEAAQKRLQDAARTEAASSIRVHVQNTTTNTGLSRTLKTMEGTFRSSMRELATSTTTSVDMQIPGLQVETWQNPQSGTIAAFAWVKKATLIKQLEKTITVCLTKAETALDQADQLVATGQKMQARDAATKTLPLFGEADEAQKLLAAVDEDADEESLQLQQTRALQNRLTGMIAQLKNGIGIYLQCRADMFGTNYSDLAGAIQGELSELGCNFVSSPAQADWAVYVTAPARKYNKADIGGMSTYFAYVDATVTVDKTATGQRVYAGSLSEKGGHTHNYEQAARDAYRNAAPKISALIKEQIMK